MYCHIHWGDQVILLLLFSVAARAVRSRFERVMIRSTQGAKGVVD